MQKTIAVHVNMIAAVEATLAAGALALLQILPVSTHSPLVHEPCSYAFRYHLPFLIVIAVACVLGSLLDSYYR